MEEGIRIREDEVRVETDWRSRGRSEGRLCHQLGLQKCLPSSKSGESWLSSAGGGRKSS